MNGPDHYREAERLVKRAEAAPSPEVASIYVGQAQVHATLAHAAATVAPIARAHDYRAHDIAWIEATS